MKRSSYHERDYAFAQAMLVLRTTIGLTQTEVAEKLHISRKAVGEWEAGITYPKVEHLKAFIVLAAEQQGFAAGREEEEIRAFWQTARQKVPLDEAWFAALLRQIEASQAAQSNVETTEAAHTHASPVKGSSLVDWGDAPTITSFYGRLWELNVLTGWMIEERCRVVSVLGLGGIGKTALATKAMHRMAEHFEVVIWRSLRDVPSCESLLDDCLQILAPQSLRDVSGSLESRQSLLLECLRRRRVLLVYDNLESFLEEGQNTGHMRPGYEGFARLLMRIAETEHQSCLLLTSREKLVDLVPLEGNRSPVRTLRVARLDVKACEQLLAEKEVTGSAADFARLIEAYAGNPLALKIVAQTIIDLFDGEIAPLLEQGEMVFGGVRELLDEQYSRLGDMERTLLCWLAIVREPVSLNELRAMLVAAGSTGELLEAVNGLLRRSLIEHGQSPGSFTLQSVVMEYVTTRLVVEVSGEIEQGRPDHLIQLGLSLAMVRDYVRRTQERLLLVPLLTRLQSFQRDGDVEVLLLSLLDQLRGCTAEAQGYGPTNLVALLYVLWGHLRGLDVSNLTLRGLYLQGVQMQDATLAGSTLQGCVFTGTFDSNWAVAISSTGKYWAAGSRQGEIRVWREAGQTLHLIWQAHTDIIRALAFSPDERTLASGSHDGTVKLWDATTGTFLWSGWHTNNIHSLAFAPDGSLLASGGIDATVRLWDPASGRQLETLQHPEPVSTITWSPDGSLLASACFDRQIRLWKMQKTQASTCVATLTGHSNWVWGLAFAPDGCTLASGSWDQTVKLWDVASGAVLQTLTGHSDRVQTLTWSPDGRILASSGFDRTILLWDVERGSYGMALQGHTVVVYALAFMPDSRSLLSASGDGTLRVWDVEDGQSIHILQGYAASLYDVAWSPDGSRLASAGSDTLVSIWEGVGGTAVGQLLGYRFLVYGVAWNPDGSLLAGSGWDNAIIMWDTTTGAVIQTLRDPDHIDTLFNGVAWSPDGKFIASGSYQQEVLVWEVSSGTRRWVTSEPHGRIRRVAWSLDEMQLAGGGDDGHVYLWDAADGTLLKRLSGHQGRVNDVIWSPDGRLLASGGNGREGGELFVWDTWHGKRVASFARHPEMVSALAWDPNEDLLISGGGDGVLRWWKMQSRECVWVRNAHQGTVQSLKVSPDGSRLASCGDDGAIMLWNLRSGEHLQTLRRDRPYERLNITRIRGLTEAQKGALQALGAIEDAPVNSIAYAP